MKILTPRERFLKALRCEQPDRVPIFDWLNNPALYETYLGEHPGYFNGRLTARLAKTLNMDAAWVPAGGYNALPSERWTWLNEQDYIDEWGTQYQLEESSWPLAFPKEYPVLTAEDWKNLTIPDPLADWRLQYARDALDEARREQADDIAVVVGLRGPMSTAWMLVGLVQMSYALYDWPEVMDEIFKTAAEFWTSIGLRIIELGVDEVCIHDDQGANNGTFFKPEHVRQFVLPHLRRQVKTLAETGTPVIFHSCGNINAVLSDIMDLDIVGLNNLQRTAKMDIKAVKAAYGDKVCLIGNIDATTLMPYGTPSDVEQAVVDCLDICAPGGGYVLATDHSFHEGISLENVQAFIEAGKKHGVYSSN